MSKKSKTFNLKTFIIHILIVFILVMAIVAIVGYINKKQFEEKKLQAIKNAFKAYETGVTAKFSDYLEYCEWEEKDIDAIVLGLSIDGSKNSRHYIDDKKVMGEIIDVFEEIEFSGATEEVSEMWNEDYIWTIQFIAGDEEYSMSFECCSTNYENVEICEVDACYPNDDSAASTLFPWLGEVAGRPILYNQNVYNKLMDIYNENIDEITIDKVREFKEENSTELTEYFSYRHIWEDVRNFRDEENNFRITWIYNFPIEGTDCYMEVERYNEFGSGAGNENTHLEIMRVEIFNKSGECIDLFECSDEEFENFIN